MQAGSAVRIIPHIVEQHAEEAAFLWLLRDAAVDAPHYDLKDLARLDERVEAHIDGLRVAAEPGWEIALAQLDQHQEASELFAAGVLALESQDQARIDQVIAVVEAVPEATRGLISALGWLRPESLRGLVKSFLDDPSPVRRMLGLAACSVHRIDPHSHLGRLLSDDATIVRARALRLIGELGRADLNQELRNAVQDPDETCRFWAARSAGLTGERGLAIPILKQHAEGEAAFKWRALDLVLRIMPQTEAMAWLRGLNSDPRHARLAVTACGILGDPAFIPWLIARMEIPDLARAAGESFSMITGIDLAYDDLETDAPQNFQAGPTDNPADDNVALDPDEDLPWPDPALLRQWWERESSRFPTGTRHLLGRPLSTEACQHALTAGFQRQRRAAAFELVLARLDAPLFNWRRGARAQQWPGFEYHEV
jgi:uncharacterized protein (TIGR02270 family)